MDERWSGETRVWDSREAMLEHHLQQARERESRLRAGPAEAQPEYRMDAQESDIMDRALAASVRRVVPASEPFVDWQASHAEAIRQRDRLMEFVRAFIAGGTNQDFRLWAREVYAEVYGPSVQPAEPRCILCDLGHVPTRETDGTWHHGPARSIGCTRPRSQTGERP